MCGFVDDTVNVTVGGNEVFRKEHITTTLQVGLAASFTVHLNNGPVEVIVSIPTKNLVGSFKFTVDSDSYLGISIINHEHYGDNIIVARDPFGYL